MYGGKAYIHKGTSFVKFQGVEFACLRNARVHTSCLDSLSWKFSLGFMVQRDHLCVFCLPGLGHQFDLESSLLLPVLKGTWQFVQVPWWVEE